MIIIDRRLNFLILNFLLIYLENISGFDETYKIDYSGWMRRDTDSSPVYDEPVFDTLEGYFGDEILITITDENKKKFIKNEFLIQFNTDLFINSSDINLTIKICDKLFNEKIYFGQDHYNLQNKINEKNCKNNEIYFKLNSINKSKELNLFSLSNFTFQISSNNDSKLIRLNNTNNFLFKIDNQLIDNYSKLFLSENFPIFTKQITEFNYIDKFNEITIFKLDNGLNIEKDYCFTFEYYNLDNSVSMQFIDEKSNFTLNLIDLDSTYYEDDLIGNYKWFKISDLCLFKMFAIPDNYLLNGFTIKLVPTFSLNQNNYLFALSTVYVDSTTLKNIEFKSYFINWNENINFVDAIRQWNHYPLLPNDNFKDPEEKVFKLILKSKPQRRSINYYCLGEVIEYESNSGLFSFNLNSNFDNFQIQIKFIDTFGKIVKYIDYDCIFPDCIDRKVEIDLNDLDSQKFTGKLNKLFRTLIKITIPANDLKQTNQLIYKNLTISSLQYSDPCETNYCLNKGKCLAISSKLSKCQCLEEYVGKKCEFENKCIKLINRQSNQTGNQYCSKFKNSTCKANGNSFECECSYGYWDYKKLKCIDIDLCGFAKCGLNENCVIESSIPVCKCKDNYYFNNQTSTCELDYCADVNACATNEDCFNIQGLDRAYCHCKPGFFRKANGCFKFDKLNPFIKQEVKLNCEHKYKYLEGDYESPVCDCFEGYYLLDDEKRCAKNKNFTEYNQCNKCNSNQTCTKTNDNQILCACKVGFSGPNCQNNICDSKEEEDKEDVLINCQNFGCKLNSANKLDPRFECQCNEPYELNYQTGKCQLIDPCLNNTCDVSNAYCVPYLTLIDSKETISSKCICRLGYTANNGRCVPKCESKLIENYKNECDLDLLNDEFQLNCDTGFLLSKTNQCYISSDIIKLNLNMIMKFSDELINKNLPKNDFINVCKNLTDQRDCILKYNNVYKNIYNFNLDHKLIDLFIKSTIKKQLINALQSIINEKEFNLTILSFQNLTEINYNQLGFKTIYSVDTLIYSRSDELDKVPLIESLNKEYIKSKCYFNKKPKSIDYLNDDCVLSSNLNLFNLNLIKPEIFDLCDYQNSTLIKCPLFSQCKRNLNLNTMSSKYYCECNTGFYQESNFMNEHKIRLPNSCQDINECNIESLNHCNLNSTICENNLGGYKCKCLKNYKRIDNLNCEEACGTESKFQCDQGVCAIYNGHYERCLCNDGWKGENCSTEVEKVKLLKTMLIIIIISLCLIIFFISLVACYFYLKRTNYTSSADNSEKVKDDYTNPTFELDRVNERETEIVDINSKI